MAAPNLVHVLWRLARLGLTGSEGSLVMGVAACNGNGYAPTRKDMLKQLAPAERTLRDAIASLIDNWKVLLEQDGRLALTPFRYLLAENGAMPGPPRGGPPLNIGEVPQHSGDTPQKHGETPQDFGNGSPPSREKAVQKQNNNGGGALTAPGSKRMDPVRLEYLKRFAERECRLRKVAAAVPSLVQTYGEVRVIEALEQFVFAYVERGREANNPPGQLIAWCKDPSKMDPLPPMAKRFQAWMDAVIEVETALKSAPPLIAQPTRRPMGPYEAKLKGAWSQYVQGKGPKPSEELEEAARREKEQAEKETT